jgi:hypothetical protein
VSRAQSVPAEWPLTDHRSDVAYPRCVLAECDGIDEIGSHAEHDSCSLAAHGGE